MPITSLGDMSTHFIARRQNAQIRSDLQRLTTELSSGRKADLTASLKGGTFRLQDIDRRLALATTGLSAAGETTNFLAMVQEGLGRIEGIRQEATSRLLAVTPESASGQIALAASVARDAFADIVSALNGSHGGESLFAGRATDRPALAAAETMLADIAALVAPETTAAGVVAAVNAWFDTPGGPFETSAYLGDTGAPITRTLDGERQIAVEVRADSPAMREVLKSAALAALAGPGMTTLTDRDRASLVRSGAEGLLTAAEPLAMARARLGEAESRVEETTSRLGGRLSALSAMRNDLVAADPFATATALQEVQTRLEIHYAVTARLASLSLVGYLR